MTITRSQSTSRPQRQRRAPERYEPTDEDIMGEIHFKPPRLQKPHQDPWWMSIWILFAILAMTYFVMWSLQGAVLGLAAVTKWLGSFSAAQLLHGFLIGAGGVLCYILPLMIICPQIFFC